MTVDGDVYLDNLRTNGGAVTFRSAKLGSLSAARAQLHNPGGYSIRLSQAVVKGPVRLIDGFRSTGLVALNRTTIDGRLHFTGGSFACPAPSPSNQHGHAIEAISATVHGSIDLGWKTVSPSVDFTDATTTFLADDPATWPERFTIAGLTYDRFENPQGLPPRPVWDQAARCAWLSRQTVFDSGPYEQAARVFRQHGYTAEAEQILIAQRRHARQVSWPGATWPRRAIDAIYATIGYGYRPARVLWLLAALLVLVAVSLEVPAAQATLRATNGNGVVYTTSGLLTTTAGATASSSETSPSPSTECRSLRRRRGALLQPGLVRDRHRSSADFTRPAIDLVPRPARQRRRAYAVVAQPRDAARLATVVNIRPVTRPPIPKLLSDQACFTP